MDIMYVYSLMAKPGPEKLTQWYKPSWHIDFIFFLMLLKKCLIVQITFFSQTGPNGATSEKLGVNYRALNDLFRISTSRGSLIDYEIWVQMVEIYNEQVRDLLSTEESPKRYPFLKISLDNFIFFCINFPLLVFSSLVSLICTHLGFWLNLNHTV